MTPPIPNNLAGTADDAVLDFAYNQAEEIASRTLSNNSYAYTGAYNVNRSYVVNGRNQYVQSGPVALGYDGRGNLSGDGTWAFGYDAENQMRSAVSTGWNDAYAYDSDNRLRSAAVNGSQTNYMYDDDDLVAEYDGGFGLLRRFVPGPGVDEPLVWYEGSSLVSKRWFTADNQGSIIAVTDGGGNALGKYAYGRWGEPGAPITGTSFAYTGQRVLPGTDLYYYKARIYSPWLGRFMQTDPIGTADDLNLYAYVGNDPANASDPSGTDARTRNARSQADWQVGGRAWKLSHPNGDAINNVYWEAWIPVFRSAKVAGIAAVGARDLAAGTLSRISANLARSPTLGVSSARFGNNFYRGGAGQGSWNYGAKRLGWSYDKIRNLIEFTVRIDKWHAPTPIKTPPPPLVH